MDERTRRRRSAAPRPRSTARPPDVVDEMGEDVTDAAPIAHAGPQDPCGAMGPGGRSLAPYAQRPPYPPVSYRPAAYGGVGVEDEDESDGPPWTEAHSLALP
ncbi:MAG: hypothetical protein ACHQ1E_14320, partial [Ktedonobacterales bacterium]